MTPDHGTQSQWPITADIPGNFPMAQNSVTLETAYVEGQWELWYSAAL
jgi:hypothetical protein